MLQRVEMDGLVLPRLYVAENQMDVELAMSHGIPFIKWNQGIEELIKRLLRPTLEKMFPGILWNKVLGRKKPVRSEVILCPGYTDDLDHVVSNYDADAMLAAQLEYDKHVDKLDHEWAMPNENGEFVRQVPLAESERDICTDWAGNYESIAPDRLRIEDYVGDLSSCVNIEVLQKLGLLPKFVGDVTDCIKSNLSARLRWTEGYTKKLGVPLGNFKAPGQLPNLLIIDVSASIPDGIAATMLMLAETLREQLNAELIITSRRSGWYPVGAELPSPQTLRDYYGRSNESAEFMSILQQHIAGREFGYVISFGDNDNPGQVDKYYDYRTREYLSISMANTVVHEVHHYHTSYKKQTGYAHWVKEVCPSAKQVFDTSWCDVMNKRYKM